MSQPLDFPRMYERLEDIYPSLLNEINQWAALNPKYAVKSMLANYPPRVEIEIWLDKNHLRAFREIVVDDDFPPALLQYHNHEVLSEFLSAILGRFGLKSWGYFGDDSLRFPLRLKVPSYVEKTVILC